MANQVEAQLTDGIFELLQKERYVTIATIDHENNSPNVNAISWVYAPSRDKVLFAVDNRSRIVQNIKHNFHVTFTLIGNGTTYSISGSAKVKKEQIDDVPLKLALVEVKVDAVRDVMFYGAKISIEPEYEKTYDAQAAAKLDRQVMGGIKRA